LIRCYKTTISIMHFRPRPSWLVFCF